MFTTDKSNINFQLASDFIQYTNRSVFLTGKAGTGKTTFLKYIKEHSIKQTAVVAPTGVAAINAGGVTIHSFFQLPFGPFVPGHKGFNNEEVMDKHQLLGRIKMSGERRKILQQLELLIIDEISMVRCDVLDAIDAILRHFRNRYQLPFGGVQVLLIGDMFQLPPVVKEDEWGILSGYYNSSYFFDSMVMKEYPPAYIELDKIYRQSDEKFINVLNQIRNNTLDINGYELLHRQYQPGFEPSKEDGYITLTTHNKKADITNTDELGKLKNKLFSFKAELSGDFSEKAFPADEVLQLKEGSQVMFIKNDLEKPRKYFNGKIGTVTTIEEDKILVQCAYEQDVIEAKKNTWENIRYTLNPSTQQVEEEVVGSFKQYPLRLAWAITIHKSQGLTFEKAVIDAGQAFAPGQVYVALSRCTSLNGVVLLSRITSSSLHNDDRIAAFINSRHTEPLPEQLLVEKHQYQSTVLQELFTFSNIIQQGNTAIRMIEEHVNAFNPEALPWIQDIQTKLEAVDGIAKKFRQQIQQLMQPGILPELNNPLQERIKAASKYFNNLLLEIIQTLSFSPAITDSKQYALAYNEELKELHSLLAQQQHLIAACSNGFTIDAYHQHKNNFTLPTFAVNAYAGASTSRKKTDSPYPVLHQQLRELRDVICDEASIPLYLVAGTNTLDEMSRYLPQTLNELQEISGFGKAKAEKFGQRFITIIVKYCEENKLSSLIHEKPDKRQRKENKEPKTSKPDTKLQSLNLFKQGKAIYEIAEERQLSVSTIESHLSHYVANGEIKIKELLSKEKIERIEAVLKGFTGSSITPIKEQLGNDISFGEIRLVMAGRKE